MTECHSFSEEITYARDFVKEHTAKIRKGGHFSGFRVMQFHAMSLVTIRRAERALQRCVLFTESASDAARSFTPSTVDEEGYEVGRGGGHPGRAGDL